MQQGLLLISSHPLAKGICSLCQKILQISRKKLMVSKLSKQTNVSSTFVGIDFLHPMRDFLSKEIGIYNYFKGTQSCITSNFATKAQPKSSINHLTECREVCSIIFMLQLSFQIFKTNFRILYTLFLDLEASYANQKLPFIIDAPCVPGYHSEIDVYSPTLGCCHQTMSHPDAVLKKCATIQNVRGVQLTQLTNWTWTLLYVTHARWSLPSRKKRMEDYFLTTSERMPAALLQLCRCIQRSKISWLMIDYVQTIYNIVCERALSSFDCCEQGAVVLLKLILKHVILLHHCLHVAAVRFFQGLDCL